MAEGFNALRYIMENTRLPGERMADFQAEWKAMSATDQETIRQWAREEAGVDG